MTPPAPPPGSPDDLAARVAALEALLGAVIAAARKHPVGRKVLASLGLS